MQGGTLFIGLCKVDSIWQVAKGKKLLTNWESCFSGEENVYDYEK